VSRGSRGKRAIARVSCTAFVSKDSTTRKRKHPEKSTTKVKLLDLLALFSRPHALAMCSADRALCCAHAVSRFLACVLVLATMLPARSVEPSYMLSSYPLPSRGALPHTAPRRHSAASASPSVSCVRVHSEEAHETIGATEEKQSAYAHSTTNVPSTIDNFIGEDAASSIALTLDADTSRSNAKLHDLLSTLEGYTISDDIVLDMQLPKKVRKFYAAQNELVDRYKAVARLEEQDSASQHVLDKETADVKQDRAVQFAIQASLALTFVSIALKFFAAIWSGSIAIIASAVDSALDVISQLTLVVTARYMGKRDPSAYPIGKSRMESLAVLVFSVIMGLAALFLLYQSTLVLSDGFSTQPEIHIDVISIVILGVTIVYQSAMYVYCRAVVTRGGRNVSAVEALAQDHGNDVCCNSLGLACAIIAAYEGILWFMDPLGGILISLYILSRWTIVCHGLLTIEARGARTRERKQAWGCS
jgi:cation diffusion facilitator family transporter